MIKLSIFAGGYKSRVAIFSATLFAMLLYIGLSVDLSVKSTVDSEISEEISPVLGKSELSDNADFPSPVIQLQQTLTNGIVNIDAPELSLLRGELKDFSNQNIPNDIPVETDIKLQKERLKALEKIIEAQ